VRRLLVLLIVAFVGAGAFGVWSATSSVKVDAATLSASTVRAELSAIASSSTLDCYLTALSPASYAAGAGTTSVAASGAAAWTNLRVEGMAIENYVTSKFHYVASASDLAQAKSSLEGEMTQSATSNQLNCPGTSAQALAAMTDEMRTAEIKAQADSVYLLTKLNSTIPLTAANITKYYNAHVSDYDTICVSVAVVRTSDLAAFAKDASAGMSVANLASKYSLDSSKTKGGAYGCYPPTSSAYATVRADVASTPLNTFPTTPRAISSNGVTYALFVAPTKRSTTPFAEAEGAVVTDLQALNASSANTLKQQILFRAAIKVDPALGRWGLTSSGPMVVAPATPPAADVNSTSLLTTPPTSAYQ
jgi:hypothetical protein